MQPSVRAYAQSLGASGQLWLNALPAAVERQCLAWKLRLGEPLSGGSRSYVCRVTMADGRRAVIKLALPEPTLATQLAVLLAARGCGYVRVFAHDLARGAFLLESLGPPLDESAADVPAALAFTAATLTRAWQAPPEGWVRVASEHKAAGLFALVRDLAGNVRGRVVDRALSYARERLKARDPGRQVVVHGDPHVGNLLPVKAERPGAETGYVFVDPEGFLCEPEYDLGVALRGWNTQLLASANPSAELRGWCGQLARITGIGVEAIWQWAYLERVSTGLYCARHGLPALGAPFLEVADRLVD